MSLIVASQERHPRYGVVQNCSLVLIISVHAVFSHWRIARIAAKHLWINYLNKNHL